MLTWEDCIGLCELDEDVIDAIATHEHVPELVALELANYLVHTDDGIPRIKRMILDDIASAQANGDAPRVEHLRHTLQHFVVQAREMNMQPQVGDAS